MKIHFLKALKDNYVYILEDTETSEALIIDPGEAAPVIDFFRKNQLQPKWIVNTHHHYDHVDGNSELKKKYQLEVLCSGYDFKRVPGADRPVGDGEKLFFTSQIQMEALMVPGHTLGHMILYSEKSESLFSGDTLFSLGCGRLFEGTPEMMFQSLKRIKSLPQDTKIYCGHEYTLKNIEFTESLEKSKALESFKVQVVDQLNKGLPSLPTTLQNELELNLFLKAKSADSFASIRAQRDQF